MSFTVFESWWKQWQHFNTNHKWKKKKLKRLISFFFFPGLCTQRDFMSTLQLLSIYNKCLLQMTELRSLACWRFFFFFSHDSVPTTFKSFWHLHSVKVKSKATAFAFPPSHDGPEFTVKTEVTVTSVAPSKTRVCFSLWLLGPFLSPNWSAKCALILAHG